MSSDSGGQLGMSVILILKEISWAVFHGKKMQLFYVRVKDDGYLSLAAKNLINLTDTVVAEPVVQHR
jgi:hypothetical protein